MSRNQLPPASSRTVWMALCGNSAITLLKGAVWLRTGSSAMLAETLHTLVDTANQAFLLLGLRHSQVAPDRTHQYGYGRAAFVWGLVSALGLFWCGAGVSVFHGALGAALLGRPCFRGTSWGWFLSIAKACRITLVQSP